MQRPMPLSEAEMQAAESRIPALAAQAWRAARLRALRETGAVVMKAANGDLVELQENGSVRFLKTLPPGTPVRPGQIMKRNKTPTPSSEL